MITHTCMHVYVYLTYVAVPHVYKYVYPIIKYGST